MIWNKEFLRRSATWSLLATLIYLFSFVIPTWNKTHLMLIGLVMFAIDSLYPGLSQGWAAYVIALAFVYILFFLLRFAFFSYYEGTPPANGLPRRKWIFHLGLGSAIALVVLGYVISRPPSPFVSALKDADRLELYLLQSSIPRDPEDKNLGTENSFPIRGYGKARTPILGHITLAGPEFERVRRQFLKATKPGSTQSLCHYPIYGFRFYRGAELAVETSICFKCGNFYAPGKDGYYWETLSDFPEELKRSLHQLLPPPKRKDSLNTPSQNYGQSP